MKSESISFKEHLTIVKQLGRWTILVIPVSIVTGSIIAFFLWLLNSAIQFRFRHAWLLYLLPLAGVFIHLIYQSIGKSSEKGNNLIIEEINAHNTGIPVEMTPLILLTTVLTHLFGGSAGREGTAVQIGASIAAWFARKFRLEGVDMRIMLTAGVAAGFGAVFGTPLTGAVFAMEVLIIGRIQYDAIIPALIASLIGDLTVSAWQIEHFHYHIETLQQSSYFLKDSLHFDLLLLAKVIFAAILFGLTSFLFAGLVHEIKNGCQQLFKSKWMVPFLGGLVIIALTLILGKPDYLSLGVNAEYPGAITIPSAFHTGGADMLSWLWKIIYTAVTLGTGFKGGEVTPLFYIGATLGNTLAGFLNAPVSLFAALGFLAVFAGATNTPLACTIMGIELFGGEHILLFAVACFTAYIFSGHSGIYTAQKIAVSKIADNDYARETSLTEAIKRRGYLYQKMGKYISPLKK